MGWLVALVVGIAFVWLLIVSPRFRGTVAFITAALVAIVAFWIRADKDREVKSHALISISQVELRDVVLRKPSVFWEVAGNIRNNSQHTLTGFTMRVTVNDCRIAADCIVIGEEDIDIRVTVPPTQLRSFDGSPNLSNMPTPKKSTWDYKLIKTTAKTD
jgi:hypothetical protein